MAKLLWVDLEMTGLKVQRDKIIEVAAVVTDYDFKPLEEFHSVVYQPQEVLDLMDDWCQKTHGASGLTAEVPKGRPLEDVDGDMAELIRRHFSPSERVVLAGNSIHNDRDFIRTYMPKLNKRLHYRMVDVSSYKEVFREKWGIKFEKGNSHRATQDIFESIKELSFYLNHVKTP